MSLGGGRFDYLEFEPDAGSRLIVEPTEIDLGTVAPPTHVQGKLLISVSGRSSHVLLRCDQPWVRLQPTEMRAGCEPQEATVNVVLPMSMSEGLHSATITVEADTVAVSVPVNIEARFPVIAAEAADHPGQGRATHATLLRIAQKGIRGVSVVVIVSAVFLSAFLLAMIVPYLKSGFVGLLLNSLLAIALGTTFGGLLMLGRGTEFIRFMRSVPGSAKTTVLLFFLLSALAAIWTGFREWHNPFRPELRTMASILMMLVAVHTALSAQRHIPRERASERWSQARWWNLLVIVPLPWVVAAVLLIGVPAELSPPLPSTTGTASFRITGIKTGRNMDSEGQFGERGSVFSAEGTDSLGVRMGFSSVNRASTVRFFFYTPSLPVIHRHVRCTVVAMRLHAGDAGAVWAATRFNELMRCLRGTWTVVVLENESPIERIELAVE